MNSYEAKQADRRERLLNAAERAAQSAQATYNQARQMGDAIPFGQPVMGVRDQNYRAKIRRKYGKAFAEDKRAGDLAAKAAAAGTGGISADDPDAIGKLVAQVEKLEAVQAVMVAANKIVRAFWFAGCRADGTPEELARYFLKMNEAGITNEGTARKLLAPDCCGRKGFADFETANNSANIRRIKARIATLERAGAQESKQEDLENGIRIVENVEANRYQILFPGKPNAATRAKLKSAGFRWAPSEGAWQRQLSNAARYYGAQIAKECT